MNFDYQHEFATSSARCNKYVMTNIAAKTGLAAALQTYSSNKGEQQVTEIARYRS
ncbi:hypothetical protein yrohd0001_4580 [Yersinia rohdei ATCC 43380]|nr:hypothetical protein yrohd0001_4580 [Yersinia rohdei ATCC 43380]